MNDTTEPAKLEERSDSERTKQVSAMGWTAGASAVAALVILSTEPSWPMAFGVAAVSAMVACVGYFALKR